MFGITHMANLTNKVIRQVVFCIDGLQSIGNVGIVKGEQFHLRSQAIVNNDGIAHTGLFHGRIQSCDKFIDVAHEFYGGGIGMVGIFTLCYYIHEVHILQHNTLGHKLKFMLKHDILVIL